MAHPVIAVHEGGYRILPDGMNSRMTVDSAHPNPQAIVGKAEDTVRVHSAEVRFHHANRAHHRILFW